MADGTYERRGPREAELKRIQRFLDERAKGAPPRVHPPAPPDPPPHGRGQI